MRWIRGRRGWRIVRGSSGVGGRSGRWRWSHRWQSGPLLLSQTCWLLRVAHAVGGGRRGDEGRVALRRHVLGQLRGRRRVEVAVLHLLRRVRRVRMCVLLAVQPLLVHWVDVRVEFCRVARTVRGGAAAAATHGGARAASAAAPTRDVADRRVVRRVSLHPCLMWPCRWSLRRWRRCGQNRRFILGWGGRWRGRRATRRRVWRTGQPRLLIRTRGYHDRPLSGLGSGLA